MSNKDKKDKKKKDTNERAFDGRNKTDYLVEGGKAILPRRRFADAKVGKPGNTNPGGHSAKRMNHADPLKNIKKKRGKHTRLKRGGRAPKTTVEVEAGHLPTVKGRDGRNKRMVQWIPIPHQADPVAYALVIREMMEGDINEPHLGYRFMETHDLTRLLTDSPRCRQDWRLVISMLRILMEESVIDKTFIETVLAEHPLLGNRRISFTKDGTVRHDYIRSMRNRPQHKWEASADRKHKAVVKTMKECFVQQEKVKYPMLSDGDILRNWREPETVPFDYGDGRNPEWVNKETFIARYKANQAERKASKLPELWRLHGNVLIRKRSAKDNTKTVTYKDRVDVEVWFKPNGGIGLGIASKYKRRGEKAPKRVSPFRKQYCFLPELRNAPSHIDGQYIPEVHDRGVVQRRPLTGDVPENESAKALAERMNVTYTDTRKKSNDAKPKRKQKQGAKRKTKAARGTPRRYQPSSDEEE
jgi:hypothetical protein